MKYTLFYAKFAISLIVYLARKWMTTTTTTKIMIFIEKNMADCIQGIYRLEVVSKQEQKKIVITIIKIAFAVTIITSLHVRCNFRLKNSVKIYILTLLLCLERFMCCQRVVRWLSAICPLENNFSLVDVDFVQTKLNK